MTDMVTYKWWIEHANALERDRDRWRALAIFLSGEGEECPKCGDVTKATSEFSS